MLRICGALSVLLIVPAVGGARQSRPLRLTRAPSSWSAKVRLAVTPDRAVLDLGVKTDKKTATAAIAENDRKMELVLAALKKELGASGDVKTSEFSVTPRFAERRRAEVNPPILGYTVRHTVHVRVDDVTASATAPHFRHAQTPENLEFTVNDPDRSERRLRAASPSAGSRRRHCGRWASASARSSRRMTDSTRPHLRRLDREARLRSRPLRQSTTGTMIFAVTAR